MTAQVVIQEIEELPASEKANVSARFESARVPSPQAQTDVGSESRRRRYESTAFAEELVAMMHDAKSKALAERDATEAEN